MDIHKTQSLLFDLIRIDSTSRKSNEPIVTYIEERLKKSGISCSRLETAYEGKYNLIAMKGEPNEDGRGLTLCGHLDTVPASVFDWESDPWELTERDTKWFARGSCDMKGFVAIAIRAIETVQVDHAPLALLLTCDEELGSFGAKHIAEQGLPMNLPKQVLIGEPTSLQVVRLHKGHLSMQVKIEGISAHTGAPHLGKNAAVAGGAVIAALTELAATFAEERTDASEHFSALTAFPVLTVATIQSGNAINVIPDRCTIGLGLRLLPDQDQNVVIARIKETIDTSCLLPWKLMILGDNPTMLTSSNAPINRWLSEHLGQPASVGVSYGTDGGYLTHAGYDCVLYGPGDIGVAHKPDEFVPISEVMECSDTIEQAIQHFCGKVV